MNKTYIIKEKIFKEISTSRGSICYLLEDGQGEKRTVRAIARLGFTKKLNQYSLFIIVRHLLWKRYRKHR